MMPPRIIDWMESALVGTGWSAAEVVEGIERGDFYAFWNETSVAVLEFITSPRHRVCHVWAVGGEKNKGGYRGYLSLVPIMEEFGRSHGCDIGGGTGRKGWLRAMQGLGYTVSAPAVEKEL